MLRDHSSRTFTYQHILLSSGNNSKTDKCPLQRTHMFQFGRCIEDKPNKLSADTQKLAATYRNACETDTFVP